MPRLRSIVCLITLLLPAFVVLGTDQEQADQPRAIGGLSFADEVEVTVVNVIVHVTDREGNPIAGLTRDDFRLYQDGDEKPISNFEALTGDAYRQRLSQLPAEQLQEVKLQEEHPELRPVHLVLYIDNENLHPLHRNRVLNRARDFVRDTLQPPVQMMVVSYQRSFKIHQRFTSDSRAVLAALRGLARYTGGFPTRDSAKHELIDLMQRTHEEEGVTGSQARDSRAYQDIYSRILAYADEEYNNLAFTIESLRGVISMIGGLPGRKGIIYLSNGLPMVPGLDLFSSFATLYQDHAIYSEMNRYDRTPLFQSLVSAANAQDITIYTIGAGGLEVPGMAAAEYRSAQAPLATTIGSNNYLDSLRFIADGTGGLATVKTNDFAVGLQRIGRDLFTYYSLGYTLSISGGDKVHRIKVEVPGHREVQLRYRPRVVERSLHTLVQDKVLTGLVFDLQENPMHLDLEAGTPALATSDRWMVPVHVSFPLRKVALLPAGEDYVGNVVLFLAARDRDGKQSDLIRQEHEVRLPAATYERAQYQRFGIDVQLLMESGSYRLAVGMLDQLTRQSSYQTLETRIQEP